MKNGEVVNAIKGFYSPIHAENLAKAIEKLIDLKEVGIINVAGERVSRMELALDIAEYFGLDKNMIAESDMVQPIKARRPFDSSLDITKAKRLIAFDFYTMRSNLEALRSSIDATDVQILK